MRELQQPASRASETKIPDTPVIETARLILRQNRLSDLDDRCAFTADPDFMRFVGGVYDRQENFSRILRYLGHWVAFGFGFFAVEEKATGRHIGNVGMARFERGLGADFDDVPEAGWLIAQSAEGKGYATEGMRAAMDWYARRFGRGRMVCMVDSGNAASLRVARKLGFHPYREAVSRGAPVILHERHPSQ
jgi:RimJ/RimL family protein N-acetyltransferase